MDEEHAKEFVAFGKELSKGVKRKQKRGAKITVDVNEDRDGVVRAVLTGFGYEVDWRRLPLGDFQWDSPLGRVIVERKTPRDISDVPRLSRQVKRLRAAAREGAFVLILLDQADWNRSRWDDFGLDHLLISIQSPIRISRCTRGQLAQKLDALWEYTTKKSHRLLDTN